MGGNCSVVGTASVTSLTEVCQRIKKPPIECWEATLSTAGGGTYLWGELRLQLQLYRVPCGPSTENTVAISKVAAALMNCGAPSTGALWAVLTPLLPHDPNGLHDYRPKGFHVLC